MPIECECKIKGIPDYLWCGKDCDRHTDAIANLRELMKIRPTSKDTPFNLPDFNGKYLKGTSND